jgi:hypothetical protein
MGYTLLPLHVYMYTADDVEGYTSTLNVHTRLLMALNLLYDVDKSNVNVEISNAVKK